MSEVRIGAPIGGRPALRVTREPGALAISATYPRAPRFAVAREADALSIAALPVPALSNIELRMYVSTDASHSTLRGDFDLHRMEDGAPVEEIVSAHSWIWFFLPTVNTVSEGQYANFVLCEGIGLLRRNTAYRMTIYWMSYDGPPMSYNALQTVDFTTGETSPYIPATFVKRNATIAPEW